MYSFVPMFVVQVKIWDIPEHGVLKNITVPRKELQGHSRRVGLIEWHPTANTSFSVLAMTIRYLNYTHTFSWNENRQDFCELAPR